MTQLEHRVRPCLLPCFLVVRFSSQWAVLLLLLSLLLQLAEAQQQASVGTQAILEASRLREEVNRERQRADHALHDAQQLLATASSSSKTLELQLLEAVAKLRAQAQVS